ncbi:MAG: CHAT domain-containing protein [Saprospiraceae bacterium]
MPKSKPLFLFAFANERQNNVEYLRALSDEMRAIKAALAPAEREGLCDVIMLPNATLGEIFSTLQDKRYRDRLTIFHYGGHANSAELLLERNDRENEPAHREGLIPLLKNQQGLQLIFLNGCSTEKWASALTEAGAPLVAGTFEAIRDQVAQLLAAQFYAGIGEGLPLRRSWDEAIARVQATGEGALRGFGRGETVSDRFPWSIFQRRGADTSWDWNLPDANRKPLTRIPLPETYRELPLPNEPFRFLDRYKKEDATIFFGRGYVIRDLYDRLTSPLGSPVILLSGQSGVGKSSLLDAGLFPRLETNNTVLYLRRDTALGLVGTLRNALNTQSEHTGPNPLLAAWKAAEQRQSRPLILILDQAEEAFTRDNSRGTGEIGELAETLEYLFGDPAEKPAGKLLLAFRKEYEGEIKDTIKAHQVDYTYIFLKRLDKQDIVEIVTGLSSQPRLAQKYGLRIEDGLPETIASDLLADSDAPVAPVLQIVLAKLWQNKNNRHYFTHAEYFNLKAEGILLSDFFRQQLEKLRVWELKLGNDAESSGLALDILNNHVTELGFANSRNLEELKRSYQHRSAILDALLEQFKNLYLLADAGPQRNTLAHDTLAPVVQQEVKNSERPGQKALRILTGKLANYRRNAEKTYIPEDDLALVEQGASGMRMWVDEEPALIEKSRKRRAALRRQRRVAWAALLILGLLAGYLGYNNYQKSIVENWVLQARLKAVQDPTTALQILKNALETDPDNPAVLAAFNDIWSDNEFYGTSCLHPDAVKGVLLTPDTSRNIYSWTENCLYFWSFDGILKDSFPIRNITALVLAPGGRFLIVASRDGALKKINAITLDEEDISLPFGREYATQLVFTGNGDTLIAARTDSTIHFLQTDDLRTSNGLFKVEDEITALALHPHRPALLIGYADGSINERSFGGKLLQNINLHKDRVLSFTGSPFDAAFVSAGRDALILFHKNYGKNILTLKGHDRRINTVQWSPDSSRLFSASDDYLIKTWSPEGDLIAVYRGHSGFVNGLSLSKDGQYFATASEDKTVRVWKTESKTKQRFGPHPSGVSGILLSGDGKTTLTAVESGISDIGETLNDPDFNLDDLIALYTGLTPRNILEWDAETGSLKNTWKGHQGGINALADDKNNKMFVSASDDSTAIIWTPGGTIFKILSGGHKGKIMAVAAAPDGRLIATAGEDRLVVLWNQKGEILKTVHQSSFVHTVAFSPEGTCFVTGIYDGTIRLYDTSGVELGSWKQNSGASIASVCFASDGQSILVGDRMSKALLYDLKGNTLATFTVDSKNKTGEEAIRSVAVSPDGKRYALGAEGGLVEVFQMAGGRPVSVRRIQQFPRKAILALAFTPDGKGILTGSSDGWGRWWRIEPEPLIGITHVSATKK